MTTPQPQTHHRAAAIDTEPGITASELGMLNVTDLPVQRDLKALGYRATQDNAGIHVGVVRWWPSLQRCAELARAATGERRERLLRGMLTVERQTD